MKQPEQKIYLSKIYQILQHSNDRKYVYNNFLQQIGAFVAICCPEVNFTKSRTIYIFEPRHDKTSNMCAPSEDLDQPGHLPSLIRVFAIRMKKAWALSYPLTAQTLISLR